MKATHFAQIQNRGLKRDLITVIGLGVILIAVLIALFVYEQQTGRVTELAVQFYSWLLP